MKAYFILLLLIPLVTSYNNRFKQRSSILRQFQDLLENDEQEFDLTRRNNHQNARQDDEEYLILRAVTESNQTDIGPRITLQNRAAMNTRLRVLYTKANGEPNIAETGRLWVGQTKSVQLPPGAKNIQITVEKDIFFENWHVAYKGTLTDENQCIRIVGVTLISRIHSCK